MAQYIKIVRLFDNKIYEFKANSFKPEYFQFEPFVEIKGYDILQEINTYIFSNRDIQIYKDLINFIKPNRIYMLFYE